MTQNESDTLLAELEKSIGHSFGNRNLLLNALMHRSYVNENPHLHLIDRQ